MKRKQIKPKRCWIVRWYGELTTQINREIYFTYADADHAACQWAGTITPGYFAADEAKPRTKAKVKRD